MKGMEAHILLTLSWGFYNNFAGSFIAAPPECTRVKKKKERESFASSITNVSGHAFCSLATRGCQQTHDQYF